MWQQLYQSPLSSIVLCIFTYAFAVYLQNKSKSPLLNPCIIATFLCILFLLCSEMTLEQFNSGGEIISLFIPIATMLLALSIYRKRKILTTYFVPVVVGCTTGALTSLVSSYLLCQLFHLEESITMAILPRSVTTAIAVEISQQLGGVVAISILCVLITGMLGAVFSPLLIKLFKIDSEIAQGIAIGTSSHVLGTTKAVELGEIQAAMSGVAIGISGIITLIIVMILS